VTELSLSLSLSLSAARQRPQTDFQVLLGDVYGGEVTVTRIIDSD
jgi:hypothetical protein